MISERFESVWDAIEDDPQEAANLRLRSALMMTLQKYLKDAKLTQNDAASLFGVTQPRVSDLMRGKIDLFSVDMLVNMATAAGIDVQLRVRKAS